MGELTDHGRAVTEDADTDSVRVVRRRRGGPRITLAEALAGQPAGAGQQIEIDLRDRRVDNDSVSSPDSASSPDTVSSPETGDTAGEAPPAQELWNASTQELPVAELPHANPWRHPHEGHLTPIGSETADGSDDPSERPGGSAGAPPTVDLRPGRFLVTPRASNQAPDPAPAIAVVSISEVRLPDERILRVDDTGESGTVPVVDPAAGHTARFDEESPALIPSARPDHHTGSPALAGRPAQTTPAGHPEQALSTDPAPGAADQTSRAVATLGHEDPQRVARRRRGTIIGYGLVAIGFLGLLVASNALATSTTEEGWTPSPTTLPATASTAPPPTVAPTTPAPSSTVVGNPTDTALPPGTGTGKRIVLSTARQRVWWIGPDDRTAGTALVSSPVGVPVPGTYIVESKANQANWYDGTVVPKLVRFGRDAQGNTVGFAGIPLRGNEPVQPETSIGRSVDTGPVRQNAGTADITWAFMKVGDTVVVID